MMLAPAFHTKQITVPVIKTIASQKKGIDKLFSAIKENIHAHNHKPQSTNNKQSWLLAEKAFYLIQQKRMADVNKADLKNKIEAAGITFNLYKFIQNYH